MKRNRRRHRHLLFAGSALAFHCPKGHEGHRRGAREEPKLSEAQMQDVKKYQRRGETLHKAGKHQESVDTLAKAMKNLTSSNQITFSI